MTHQHDIPAISRLGNMSLWRSAAAFLLIWVLAHPAHAQDARQVSEPVMPSACTTLTATYPSPDTPHADDTARIQDAIDHCPAGQAVKFVADGDMKAFVSGPLAIRNGVSLWVDGGATLYATPDPEAYDKGQHTCGTNDKAGNGCKPFITVDASNGSSIVGDGVIDGQGGHAMLGKSESWWQLSRRAQKESLNQNVPHLLVISHSKEVVLYHITLRNSLKFHVVLTSVEGFTAWGVKIDTPAEARNTDGIDPGSSRNVTIAYSFIRDGDDNVAIKSGKAGPSENISILHNHFYSGHGMSIGSGTDGGIRHILVEDLSMDGTTSGLRIKSDLSRGGLVTDVHYRNVCLRDVRTPLDVTTDYEGHTSGNKIPFYNGIFFEHVHSLTSERLVMHGIDAEHPFVASFDDVVIDGKPVIQASHTHLTLGPGPVRPVPSGDDDVTTDGTPAGGAGIACDGRFAPFPAATAEKDKK